jgi:ATP adenylyltransferase
MPSPLPSAPRPPSPAGWLWAPWRSDFVSSPKPRNGGCFLCDIASHPENDAETYVVARTDKAMLLLNRYPYNGGHLMAAPLRHVASFGELEEAERAAAWEMAHLGEKLLTTLMHPDGFNFGINQGTAAGAGLKEHVHLHIVPRWTGDSNFLPVLSGDRVVSQGLQPLHDALCRLHAASPERPRA